MQQDSRNWAERVSSSERLAGRPPFGMGLFKAPKAKRFQGETACSGGDGRTLKD